MPWRGEPRRGGIARAIERSVGSGQCCLMSAANCSVRSHFHGRNVYRHVPSQRSIADCFLCFREGQAPASLAASSCAHPPLFQLAGVCFLPRVPRSLQTAMRLFKKTGDDKYLMWAVCTMALQVGAPGQVGHCVRYTLLERPGLRTPGQVTPPGSTSCAGAGAAANCGMLLSAPVSSPSLTAVSLQCVWLPTTGWECGSQATSASSV